MTGTIKTLFIYFLYLILNSSHAKDVPNTGEMVNIVAFGEGRCSDTS